MDVDAKVEAIMTGDPEWVRAVTGVEPVELVVGSLRHAIKAAPGRVTIQASRPVPCSRSPGSMTRPH